MPVEIVPENTYFYIRTHALYVVVTTSVDIQLTAYVGNEVIGTWSLTKGRHRIKVWSEVPAMDGIFTVRFVWSGGETGERSINCVYYARNNRSVAIRDEKGSSLPCYVSMFDMKHYLVAKMPLMAASIPVPTAFVHETTWVELYKRNDDGTVYYWVGLVKDMPSVIVPQRLPADKVFLKLTLDKAAARQYVRTVMPLIAWLPDTAIDVYLNYSGKWQIALMVCKTLGINGEIWEVSEDDSNIYVTIRVLGGPIAEAIISFLIFITKIGVITAAIYFGLDALSKLVKSISMVLQPATYITDNYSAVQKEIAETISKVATDTTLTPDEKEKIITALTAALVSIGGQVKEAVAAAAPTSTIIAIALAAFAIGMILARVRGHGE